MAELSGLSHTILANVYEHLVYTIELKFTY